VSYTERVGGHTGWSGGQYSLFRALVGIFLTVREPILLIPAAAFAIGFYDRIAAVLLAGGLIALEGRDAFAVVWLLVAHLVLPPAPYGSWSAVGRPNPDGNWRMPIAVQIGGAFALIASLALIGGAGRPWAWRDVILLAIFLVDPGWLRRKSAKPAIVFYDGHCGLCHRTVRFLLAEDRSGSAFRFAAIGGKTFRAMVPEGQRASLPDSVVLRTGEGALLARSEAILEAARRLGGYWRVLAAVTRFIPRALRDTIYDAIARRRKRLFGAPEEACPLLAPELRKRFDS
jgi:predicted DCC family thiol-disulfide oxidoreductase YuxK